MIPDDRVERYYYIFDSRKQRALVMDRLTGEEYAWGEASRTQLVDHVQEKRSGAVLRRFARWCARQTDIEGAPHHSPSGRLWATVPADGERGEPRQTQADLTDAVALAAAVGLPRRRPDAARLLTVHACTHASARRAALDAAHMSERWAEFTDGNPRGTAQQARQDQIDWLLDALGAA